MYTSRWIKKKIKIWNSKCKI